jgi:uncharacterized protein
LGVFYEISVYVYDMDQKAIKSTIDRAGPELRAAGISALYLFGSQARGDAGDASDIDLAFDVAEEANADFSLIDQARVQLRLEELMGHKVDFFERRALIRRFGAGLEPLFRLL